MNQNAGITKSKLYFELIAFAIAFLVAIVILIPLYNNTLNYTFFLSNFLFIFLFITFTRYIFFLRFSIFSHITIAKLIFIFATIPLAVLLMDAFSVFQEYADTIGLQEFVKHLDADRQSGIVAYMRNQMLFFGAGSILTCVLLAFRCIISIWRVRNRGTV